MARMDAKEIFLKLVVALFAVFILDAFGLVDIILDALGVSFAIPSMMSVLVLVALFLGVMVVTRVIVGARPTKTNLLVDLALAAGLFAFVIFKPDILPPGLAAVARAAQAVLGFG